MRKITKKLLASAMLVLASVSLAACSHGVTGTHKTITISHAGNDMTYSGAKLSKYSKGRFLLTTKDGRKIVVSSSDDVTISDN